MGKKKGRKGMIAIFSKKSSARGGKARKFWGTITGRKR